MLIGHLFHADPNDIECFTELANAGRPLFPGNDVDDQLKRIFKYPLMCEHKYQQF